MFIYCLLCIVEGLVEEIPTYGAVSYKGIHSHLMLFFFETLNFCLLLIVEGLGVDILLIVIFSTYSSTSIIYHY